MKRINKLPKGVVFQYKNAQGEYVFKGQSRVYVVFRMWAGEHWPPMSYSIKEWEMLK